MRWLFLADWVVSLVRSAMSMLANVDLSRFWPPAFLAVCSFVYVQVFVRIYPPCPARVAMRRATSVSAAVYRLLCCRNGRWRVHRPRAQNRC